MAVLYRHIRPDKNEVFYVGIGDDESRAHQFNKGRNRHWRAIWKKCNREIEVEILFEDLTWEEACEKEIELIAFYGREDLGLGTLCNMTNGGEGVPGRKRSPESIEKFKISMSKIVHPMLGKTHSEEARKKISEAGRKRVCLESTKEKLRIANSGHTINENQKRGLDRTGTVPTNAIKIQNTETNEIFDSIRAASTSCGLTQQTFKRHLLKGIIPFIIL